ncbi:MAG: UTP--glucose-1-phosphate uridylyltransferase [Planctomyces sp.]
MTTAHAQPAIDAIREQLRQAGQEHLLTFVDQITPEQRSALLAQIASLDLRSLPGLIERYVRASSDAAKGSSAKIEPVPYFAADHTSKDRGWDREAYARKGRELIGAGKIAAFTVAGGQGSRLGYDGPKGCYPGGAVTGKPLFACLADWILAAQERYRPATGSIPWYIMTSPLNHEATVAFFKANGYFGLKSTDVMFFPQGVMPSLDLKTGRVLLSQKHEVALNPDGHGGSLKALYTSGAIDDMAKRGVEHISYTQIDNPLVRVIDPAFIGLHAASPQSSGEMSSKMVAKSDPGEKVGVLCKVNGRVGVIEYSDLPAELAQARDADGGLTYSAGSIAVHMIGVEFVRRLNAGAGGAGGGFTLPFHRAEKKVPFVDLSTGQRVEPTSNNAVKLEAFVFDALPMAARSIVLETQRLDEFAPIKNATGSDSPASCAAIQTRRAARWLGGAGCRVPYKNCGAVDAVIEISPRTAMDAGEMRAGGAGAAKVPAAIPSGAKVVI